MSGKTELDHLEDEFKILREEATTELQKVATEELYKMMKFNLLVGRKVKWIPISKIAKGQFD